MSRVTSANCIIDLTDRTKSIYDSMPVVLLDAEGSVVDASFMTDSILASVVRMNILPYIDLPLDQYINTVGELDDNYEISSISINPAYLSIAGQLTVLDGIASSVSIEPINVSDLVSAGTYTQKVSLLGLPSDVTLLSDNNFIITIEVVDKTVTTSLTCVLTDANITGRDSALYNYQFTNRSCIVEFTGPSRFVRDLTENDVVIHVDVSTLSRGYNEVVPTVTVAGDPSWLSDGSVHVSVGRIICVLTTVSGS